MSCHDASDSAASSCAALIHSGNPSRAPHVSRAAATFEGVNANTQGHGGNSSVARQPDRSVLRTRSAGGDRGLVSSTRPVPRA